MEEDIGPLTGEQTKSLEHDKEIPLSKEKEGLKHNEEVLPQHEEGKNIEQETLGGKAMEIRHTHEEEGDCESLKGES